MHAEFAEWQPVDVRGIVPSKMQVTSDEEATVLLQGDIVRVQDIWAQIDATVHLRLRPRAVEAKSFACFASLWRLHLLKLRLFLSLVQLLGKRLFHFSSFISHKLIYGITCSLDSSSSPFNTLCYKLFPVSSGISIASLVCFSILSFHLDVHFLIEHQKEDCFNREQVLLQVV